MSGPFVYDDYPHVADNASLARPSDLVGVLYSGWQGTRPLFNLSLAASALLVGNEPADFRWGNLFLHLLCGVLVFRLGKLLGLSEVAALTAAAIFLLHPLQTESVVYINSRSGLLAAFFGLAAVVSVRRWPAVGALCSVAAVASKESAVILPMLGWLALRSWRTSVPLLAGSVALPLLYWAFPTPHHGTVGLGISDAAAHVRAEPLALVRLGQLVLLPFGQSVDHAAAYPAVGDAAFWGPLLVIVGTITAAICLRREAPWFSFAVGWFFFALVPTNSIVPFVDVLAERHAYLAVVGPAMAISFLIDRWSERTKLAALWIFLGLLGLSAATYWRASLWQSEESLWADAAAKAPGKARPHLNWGVSLATKGELPAALREFRLARSIDSGIADAHFNEGLALRRLGRPGEALAPLREAVRRSRFDATAHLELAETLVELARHAEALEVLEVAAALPVPKAKEAQRRRAELKKALLRPP